MIWFKVKELERRLAEGNISDKEGFNYLLINLILYTIVPYMSVNDYENKWLMILEMVLMILITFFGVKKTFDINKNGDGNDYFKRFLSLSFVNGIRLLIFLAIPLGIISYLIENVIGNNKNSKDLVNLAVISIGTVIYYFMLFKSFGRLNDAIAAQKVNNI